MQWIQKVHFTIIILYVANLQVADSPAFCLFLFVCVSGCERKKKWVSKRERQRDIMKMPGQPLILSYPMEMAFQSDEIGADICTERLKSSAIIINY